MSEVIVSVERNDRIDSIGNALDVQAREHLSHVGRDIATNDLDGVLRHLPRSARSNVWALGCRPAAGGLEAPGSMPKDTVDRLGCVVAGQLQRLIRRRADLQLT